MSVSAGSAMSVPANSRNREWNRILGRCEPCFHTRPMCTASVLCIGISGDTFPHSAGGQFALGSGLVCARTAERGPIQIPKAANSEASVIPNVNVLPLVDGIPDLLPANVTWRSIQDCAGASQELESAAAVPQRARSRPAVLQPPYRNSLSRNRLRGCVIRRDRG